MQTFLVLFGGRTIALLPGRASGPDPLSNLLIFLVHGQELRVLFSEAVPTWRSC